MGLPGDARSRPMTSRQAIGSGMNAASGLTDDRPPLAPETADPVVRRSAKGQRYYRMSNAVARDECVPQGTDGAVLLGDAAAIARGGDRGPGVSAHPLNQANAALAFGLGGGPRGDALRRELNGASGLPGVGTAARAANSEQAAAAVLGIGPAAGPGGYDGDRVILDAVMVRDAAILCSGSKAPTRVTGSRFEGRASREQ